MDVAENEVDGFVRRGFFEDCEARGAVGCFEDFGDFETGVAQGAPRFMEWYAAFGLLVTLVWLYMEILRLLSKINRRN